VRKLRYGLTMAYPEDPPSIMAPMTSTQRADARRNRQRLIGAAARAFASGDENVTLEAIARASGVGIGTLYRHFPTREALVEAVYRDQVERLRSGAQELLAAHRAARALRLWMDLFADWVATKRGMTDTLRAMISSGDIGLAQTRSEILAIVRALTEAAADSGEVRDDVAAGDVVASLAGILAVAGAPAQRNQAGRLFDLLMDGLRTPTGRDATEPAG
jgi:AcrR family transcriptional regulator